MGRQFFPNAFVQSLLLFVVAALIAAAANFVRPTPVPWDDRPAYKILPTISVGRALDALTGGETLFVDARPDTFYAEGHVLNALSLPVKSTSPVITNTIPLPHPYRLIIVYCDDEHCDAADAMARKLDRLGYDKLFVLEGGWRAWTQANLPMEQSEAAPNRKGPGNE